MKILVLAPYFAPYNNPRALRWTSLVREFEKAGVKTTVLCSKLSGTINTEEFAAEIIPVGYNSLQEFLALKNKRNNGQGGPTKNWKYVAHQLLWKPYIFPDESFIWKRPAVEEAMSLMAKQKLDAIISVGLPFSAHLVGKELKAAFPELIWLMDIGDPYALQEKHPISNPILFKRRSKILERECLLQCDCAVVTNAAMKAKYAAELGVEADKIYVLPPINSLEFTDAQSPAKNGAIEIGYFGNFFKNIRDPKVLLDVMCDLDRRGKNAGLTISWHFFGDGYERFQLKKKIESADISVAIHSKLERDKIASAMESMQILLHFGNATDFQIPSKIAEYISSGKPILHVQQIDNDPVLDLLKNYPYHLNLKVPATKGMESSIISFFKNAGDQRTDPDLLDMHRKKFNPERIAVEYLRILKSRKG